MVDERMPELLEEIQSQKRYRIVDREVLDFATVYKEKDGDMKQIMSTSDYGVIIDIDEVKQKKICHKIMEFMTENECFDSDALTQGTDETEFSWRDLGPEIMDIINAEVTWNEY